MRGHNNAVFSVEYNFPFWFVGMIQSMTNSTNFLFDSDRVATSSFDKTVKIWSVVNGSCLRTFYGHTAEVVATEFSHSNSRLASASMDSSAKIFDVETGIETQSYPNHDGEVIAVHFNRNENVLLAGSFDSNGYLWDLRSKE